MAEPGAERLRAMAATVRAELPRIDQCASEAATVARVLERSDPSGAAAEERVAVYAAAAVLKIDRGGTCAPGPSWCSVGPDSETT